MKIFPFCVCVTENHQCERTVPITLQPAILLVSPSQPPHHLESHVYVFALFSRWGDAFWGQGLLRHVHSCALGTELSRNTARIHRSRQASEAHS